MPDETPTNEVEAPETPESEAPAPKAKTYSKAEVDAMVNKAKVATRKEFGDILELRQKAEEYDKLQESSKSEADKLRDRADRAVRDRDAAVTRVENAIRRSAIVSAASRLGSVDPEAVAALIPREDVVVEGDEAIGAEEAVKALLAKKPYLRQGASRAGAEINGAGEAPAGPIARSQIREWLRSGQMTPEREKQVREAQKAGKILLDR